MPRVKETGKYIYRIAEAELKKKAHLPDLVLIPDNKYKKNGMMGYIITLKNATLFKYNF